MGILDLLGGKTSSIASNPGLASRGGGILDALLGSDNPFAQFADNHQNTFGAIGAGLAAGQTFSQGLANAAQGVPQARQLDQQTNIAIQQQNATFQYLKAKHPDLAQAVLGGMPIQTAWQQALQLDNPAPMVVPAGSTVGVYDRGTQSYKPVGGQQTDGFYSTDLKSQAWNIVMKANSPGADPALKESPQFQSAWAIATEPTSTPNGLMQPQLPPNWGPNASQGASPAPDGSAVPPQPQTAAPAAPIANGGWADPVAASRPGGMAMMAQPANVQNGPGIINGTQPFNESQARTNFLAQSAIPDLKRVIDGYPALTNFKDQVAGALPGGVGRVAQSSAFKQAKDAMSNSMVDLLYFASGANINKDEWARKAEAYLPQIGDDGQTAANKLDRFAGDVVSLANAGKDPQTIDWAQQAVAGIKNTEAKLLQGNAPPQGQQQSVPAGTKIWGPDGKAYVMGPDGTPQPVM